MAPQDFQGEILKNVAIGIAVTSLLFAVSIKSPFLGFFCSILIPLPTLFYRSKLGRTIGVIVPVFSIIVMFVMLGRISIETLFLAELLLVGFVLSELFEMELSIEKTMLYTCSVVLLTGIICLFFYSNTYDIEIYTLVSGQVAKNIEQTVALYEKMEVSQENIYLISNSLDQIQYVLVRIIPALVIASILFVSWTSLLLAKPILKAGKLFYPDFGTLNLWKAPDFLVWGVVVSGAMLLLPDRDLKIVGLNGLLVLMIIYFFQGIAIVSFYFEKKRFPRILRVFLYTLIGLQQLVLFLVIGLGFFDMWLNFRKFEVKKYE